MLRGRDRSRGAARSRVSAVRGFNPRSIANLAAWYRADQGITIVTGVSQWNDLSGNGNHATQGTGGAQPLFVASGRNGRPTIRFDGVDDTLSLPLVAARGHVFAVIKQVAAANQPWLSQGNTTNGFTCAWLTGAVRSTVFVAASGVGWGQTCSATSDTNWHYLSLDAFAASNSSNVVYYDGVNKDTGTDGTGGYGPTTNGMGTAGSGTFASVEIAELCIFSAQKTAAERALLQAYFKAGWAL